MMVQFNVFSKDNPAHVYEIKLQFVDISHGLGRFMPFMVRFLFITT